MKNIFPNRIVTTKNYHFFLGLLAALLVASSLSNGLQIDDKLHRLILLGKAETIWPFFEYPNLFTFAPGDPDVSKDLTSSGFLPWWTDPMLKVNFFRPLSILTHQIDYALWPDSPVMMHVVNVAGYSVIVILVASIFGALFSCRTTAVLAGLIYAIDEAHGSPVGWIANRNSLLAAMFGFLALLWHTRWKGIRIHRETLLSVVFLIFALISAEFGIGVYAFILCYEVFVSTGETSAKFKRMAPASLTIVIWLIFYRASGHGAAFSGDYIDPFQSPAMFAEHLMNRLPILFSAQIFGPSSESAGFFPQTNAGIAFAILRLLSILVAVFIYWFLEDKRMTRFLLFGSILALIPVTAVFPHDRLLLFSSFGSSGLIAAFLVQSKNRIRSGICPLKTKWLLRIIRIPLIKIHLILAPILMIFTAWSPRLMGRVTQEWFAIVKTTEDAENRTHFMLNPPVSLFAQYLPIEFVLSGLNAPIMRTLGPASSDLELTAMGDDSFRMKASPSFVTGYLDSIFRSRKSPFHARQTIALDDYTITIIEIAQNGFPSEIEFRANRRDIQRKPLWWRFEGFTIKPFSPPSAGETIRIPGVKGIPIDDLLHRLLK